MSKRILAMLLALVMIFSVMPVSAFAAPNSGHSYSAPAKGWFGFPWFGFGQPQWNKPVTHEHVYEKTVTKLPTWWSMGTIKYTCTVSGCNNSYTENFSNWNHYFVKSVKDATCLEDGLATWTCVHWGCGLTYTEVIPAAGEHDYVVVKELAPTCIEAGYVWKECSVCGAEKNHEIGEATGEHDYVVVKELAPTCLEAGYVWKECSVCGAEKNHEVGEAKGEHGQTYIDTLEANCSAEGYKKTYCQDCDMLLSEEVLPKNDVHFFYNGKCLKCGAAEKACEHESTYTFTQEANCSADGLKQVYCKDCEELLSEEVLAKNDLHAFYNGKCVLCGADEECKHEYEVVKEMAATCTLPKYVWQKCTKCGNEKNGEVGAPDATAHSYEVVKEEAATCTLPKYVWQKCTECGNEKNGEVGTPDATAHSYEVVKEEAATCTLPKYVWQKCTECGNEKNGEQGAALGHEEVVLEAVAATCTELGRTEGKACSRCNAILVHQDAIAALGHTEVDVPGKPATCTESGLTDGKWCSVCEMFTENQKFIPALGHTEVDVPGKPATCTAPGLTAGKWCSVCSTFTENQKDIPALGHSEIDVPGKEATCSTSGLTAGKWCSVCSKFTENQKYVPETGKHAYVDGTCSDCGAVDPNYNPCDHSLMNGDYCMDCGAYVGQ